MWSPDCKPVSHSHTTAFILRARGLLLSYSFAAFWSESLWIILGPLRGVQLFVMKYVPLSAFCIAVPRALAHSCSCGWTWNVEALRAEEGASIQAPERCFSQEGRHSGCGHAGEMAYMAADILFLRFSVTDRSTSLYRKFTSYVKQARKSQAAGDAGISVVLCVLILILRTFWKRESTLPFPD